MSALTIAYSRYGAIGAVLIRHADRFGRWSHCGIVTPDQSVIESRWPGGVVETSIRSFERRASHYEYRAIACPDPDAAIAFARAQVGKGYDLRAIFGLLLRNSWEDADKWHCAELVEAALVAGGNRRFIESAWRISPNMSYIVA